MDVRLSRKMRLIDITMIGIGAMGDERRRCLCLNGRVSIVRGARSLPK